MIVFVCSTLLPSVRSYYCFILEERLHMKSIEFQTNSLPRMKFPMFIFTFIIILYKCLLRTVLDIVFIYFF